MPDLPKERYKAWTDPGPGRPYDPECCAAEVARYPDDMGLQCRRKRGYGRDGLFCKQHASTVGNTK